MLIAAVCMQLSRQDVEAFMLQKGCPPLPDHIPEWQTPHLAKPPPEEVEDGELDEEAAEAKMQEERLAVGEGLVGDLAMVRTKRDHPSADSDDSEEPSSKKQKVCIACMHVLAACKTCLASKDQAAYAPDIGFCRLHVLSCCSLVF